MQHTSAIALAIAQFVLAANAQVDLDMDDVPNPCKTICKPIGTLADRCDVDLRSDNDRDEHHLQNQCICTNKSFDVAKIAALCADCMHQSRKNKRDDDDNHADRDDLKDIDNLLSECGFSSTTYNSAATSEVASITVVVNRPTDISQLTTTIDRSHPGAGGAGGGNSATATSSSQSGQSTSGASASSSSSSRTAVTSQPAGSSSQNNGGGGGAQTSSSGSGAAGTTTSPNAGAAVTAQAVYAVGGLVAAAALLA